MGRYKVLVVGVGNMGSAHAKAYYDIQEFLLHAIENNIDLSDQLDAVINSMKIVLAADESVRLGKQVSIT